jgi:hypothetical protein
MVLAKITMKHEHSSIVMGVAVYHGLVCAVYSVRVSCAGRYVHDILCILWCVILSESHCDVPMFLT